VREEAAATGLTGYEGLRRGFVRTVDGEREMGATIPFGSKELKDAL